MAPTVIEKERSLPPHRLGLKGHFSINPDLLRTANDYGGYITRYGDHFRLTFPGGEGQFDYNGDLRGLKKYLWELKQPIHTAIRDAVVAENKASDKKQGRRVTKEQFNQEKILVHRILRYATTGSTSVPAFSHEHLDKDFAACHADTEQQILTDDMWRVTGEIDVNDRIKHHDPSAKKPLQSAILPGTDFNPRNGFSIKLTKPLTWGTNDNADPLGEWFSRTIHEVTRGRYAGRQVEEISLTPAEMTAFCRRAHNDIKKHNLEKAINAAGFDERLQEIIARIDSKVSDIENSDLLRKVVQNGPDQDTQAKLRQLALGTSALTPVVNSEALRERWKHYFFSQRHKAPMEKISGDFRLLQAVCDHYGGMENVSPAHLEAIAMDPDLHPTIAFAKETCSTLEQALEKAEKKEKRKFSEESRELKQEMAALEDMFGSASLSGLTAETEHLPEEYKAVLEILKLSTGQGDDALKRMGKKFVGNSVDFISDIYKYPFRGPMEFAITAASGLAIHYWMNRGGQAAPVTPQAVGALQDAIPGLEDMSSPENLPQVGLPEMKVDPRGGREGIDWHKHFNPLAKDGFYRHYFNEMVSGTSRTFLSLFESIMSKGVQGTGLETKEISEFSKGAYPTVEAMKPINYIANLAQNYLGHLVYFASMGAKGVQSGPRGIGRLLSFFGGFHDAARSAAVDRPLTLPLMATGFYFDQILPRIQGSDMTTGLTWVIVGTVAGFNASRLWPKNVWPRKTKSPLEFTEAVTQNARNMMKAAVEQDVSCKMDDARMAIAEKLGEAAMRYAEIEASLPASVRTATVSLQYRSTDNEGAQGWKSKTGRYLDNAVRWTRLRNTGLSKEFTINAGNLKPVMNSLQQMDMALTLFGEQIGADGKIYQGFVKTKLDHVVKAIEDYQHNRIDEAELSEALDVNLHDVIAAQIHLTGSSPIFEKLYGHAPNTKDFARFSNSGAHAHGHQDRLESVQNADRKLGDAMNNMKMIKMRAQVTNESLVQKWSALANEQLNSMGQTAKMNAITAWDMVVDGARAVQHGFGNIGYKKPIAIGLGVAAMTATGMDFANYSGPGVEVVNALSFATGISSAVTTVTGTFLIVNTADDQIMVHMGVGGACLLMGSSIYMVNKYGVQPAAGYTKEKVQQLREWMSSQFKGNTEPPPVPLPVPVQVPPPKPEAKKPNSGVSAGQVMTARRLDNEGLRL